MTENDYRREAATRGYEEPVLKTWNSGYSTDVHTHEKSVYLLIKDGTPTIGIETAAGIVSTTLTAGSTIEVPAGCQHLEQAIDEAVHFFVAVKS